MGGTCLHVSPTSPHFYSLVVQSMRLLHTKDRDCCVMVWTPPLWHCGGGGGGVVVPLWGPPAAPEMEGDVGRR